MADDTSNRSLGQCPSGREASAGGVLRTLPAFGEAGYRAVRSLYIHVPFCFHKCHYCDFYSIVDTRVRQREFLDRLVRELRAFSPWVVGEPLETIFVGGGTPSLLAVELWQKFLIELDRLFDLSRVRSGAGEFTVECNPETVTPELLAVLASGGVGRVSVGAQSFDPRHLKTLERWHDPQNVERAIDLARQAGIGRQSIDLIYGIPGQSVEDWQRDLERAIGLGTEHVSCYCLTYEPNTAMTRRMQRGEFEPAPDETEAAMFRLTAEMLGRAGLTRYEISNYARQGAHCAHNMNYWRNGNWLAAGPSASAHVHGYRWKNVQRLGDWLEQSDDGFATVTDLEKPDRARSLCERMMLGIRLDEGLSAAEMLEAASAIDLHAPARLLAEVEAYAAVGDLETTGGVWRLSEEGQLRADAVASDLMAAISTQQV